MSNLELFRLLNFSQKQTFHNQGHIFLHIQAHVRFYMLLFDSFCFKESQNFNPNECKNTDIGIDYRGTLSLTKSGKPCKVCPFYNKLFNFADLGLAFIPAMDQKTL